ncbi:TPA: AbgT family transporter [Clostridioides difficile]
MNDNVVKKKNFFDRTLNRIETVGNKLPDPVTIFLGLCVLLLILSSLVVLWVYQ